MRLMSKSEYVTVPKGTKFIGSGELGLTIHLVSAPSHVWFYMVQIVNMYFYCLLNNPAAFFQSCILFYVEFFRKGSKGE